MSTLEMIQARMGRDALVEAKAALEVYIQAVEAVLAMERQADGLPVLDFLAANAEFQTKIDRVQDLLGAEVQP